MARVAAAGVMLLATGCGQKGPLRLPEGSATASTPAAPAASAATR